MPTSNVQLRDLHLAISLSNTAVTFQSIPLTFPVVRDLNSSTAPFFYHESTVIPFKVLIIPLIAYCSDDFFPIYLFDIWQD